MADLDWFGQFRAQIPSRFGPNAILHIIRARAPRREHISAKRNGQNRDGSAAPLSVHRTRFPRISPLG
jgi:hypothetical protein